nr:hypothetical protein [Arsenicicoccus piscis]
MVRVAQRVDGTGHHDEEPDGADPHALLHDAEQDHGQADHDDGTAEDELTIAPSVVRALAHL